MNKQMQFALIFVSGAVTALTVRKKALSLKFKNESLLAEAVNKGIKTFKDTIINGVTDTLTGKTSSTIVKDNYLIDNMKKHGATREELETAQAIVYRQPGITQAEKAALNYYTMKYVTFGGN